MEARLMCLIALLTSAVALHAAPTPTPTPVPTSDEIRDAVRDLDDSNYKVRTAAARKLLAAGKLAIVPLSNAAEGGSVGAADRAVKLLEDLAFKGGDDVMPVARDALHRLAKSKTQVSEQAREILKRYRGQILDQMQTAGARFQFDGDNARAIYLDSVEDLKSVLPLLREFPEMEEVSVSTKKFGDTEFPALLPLKNLKWLNLFESNIGDESLKLLKNFPELESIPMGHTRVTDDGMKHLTCLKKLEYLGLRGNNITDAGVSHLKSLTTLTGLTLQETKIGDKALAHLKEMSKLNHLRLQGTAITDAGLAHLHSLATLRQIDLEDAKVTARGIEELRKAIPEARVVFLRDE